MNKKLGILSVVIVAIIGVYFGATLYLEKRATDQIDKMITGSGVDLKYEDVSINLAASTLTINNIDLETHKISKLVLKDIYSYDYRKKSVPKHLNVEFKGVTINTGKLRQDIQNDIRKLGYSGNLDLDFGVNYSYDKDRAFFTMESMAFDVKDMYKINFRADLDNIKLDFDNPGSFMEVLLKFPEYRISFSEVSYQDDSFMKRVMESMAKNNNTNYETQKERIEKMIAQQISLAGDQSVKDFYAGTGKIMFEPGNYSLRISPEKPVSIKEIMDMKTPDSVIKKLNLTIQ